MFHIILDVKDTPILYFKVFYLSGLNIDINVLNVTSDDDLKKVRNKVFRDKDVNFNSDFNFEVHKENHPNTVPDRSNDNVFNVDNNDHVFKKEI